MIVSGFTQKKVEKEDTYGCSLDHAHCITCMNRLCKVTANGVTACELRDCPRGCGQRYHSCKENEHALLCPEERVACINSMYGCPAMLHRRKLAEHLNICPASTVHCQAEWNRVRLEPFKPYTQEPVVMKKTNMDCGQLDTALAMRDHRVLVDRLLNPADTATTSPGCLIPVHPTPPTLPAPVTSSSDVDLPPAVLPDQWGCGIRQMKKAALSKTASPPSDSPVQPAASLSPSSSSSSGCVSDNREPLKTERAGSSSGRCAETEGRQERGRTQALGNVLSLSMRVECMARYLPKSHTYTFLCAQDVRRSEFSHHFYSVHNRIQSDLNGWMEQRCPLAYLGCPFSFRRFRPSQPNMTICHSWLLESFGMTSVGPAADMSHQMPSRLLPAFPETASCEEFATRCEEDQYGDGLTRCKSAGPSQASSDVVSLSAVSETRRVTGADPELGRCEASNTPDSQLSEKVGASGRDPLSGSSDCSQSPHATTDGFSSLLNSISLEDGGAGQLLNPPLDQHQGNSVQQGEVPGQGRGDRHPENGQALGGSSDLESVQHYQDNSGLPSALSPSVQTPQVPVVPNGPSLTAKPSSFSSPPSIDENSGVIYTGVTANSCIRADTSTSETAEDSTKTKDSSPALQLGDLPSEIFRHMISFLDSFSLYNLSLVSRSMRDLCCTLLQERGMVSLVWNKQLLGNKVIWRIGGKSWKFSTSFAPVESWSFTGHNPIPTHLLTCPYNQDRVERSEKFSIVPISEVPLNIQIRDMLQELLQQRRNFRGWIIRSNFEREYFENGRPLDPCLAGVLTALGGTLPQ